MVREFHTRDEEEENSLELLFSPSGILSHVLRRKTLYRKFVKKKKKSGDEETVLLDSDRNLMSVNDELTL